MHNVKKFLSQAALCLFHPGLAPPC